ncbi:MAG: hypothetical protein R3F17_11200 [Planctomycetota bacterium]
MQGLEVRRVFVDATDHDGRLGHLLVRVDAETAQAVELDGGVGGTGVAPGLHAAFAENALEDHLHRAGAGHAAGQEDDLAVHAQGGAAPRTQNQVGGPRTHHHGQPSFDLVTRRQVGVG